jgi:murein DD-endopeptidase MepM/ murein hydrolase activator NlpD
MSNSLMISQKGNVAGQMLIGLVLVAVFCLAVYFFGPKENDTEPTTPKEPVVEEPAEPPVEEEPVVEEPEQPVEEDGPLTDGEGDVFSFLPVGELLPESGPGFVDETIYRVDIEFPTEDRAFLNSQVYRFGGFKGHINGMEGGQCNVDNYRYPWQDTFCEKRSRTQQLCPGGGHEGLDIRPASCSKDMHWAIAVEDARVIDIRRHWVTLQTDDGTLYNYLHLNMAALEVALGDSVVKGQRIGRISNDFFKSDGTSVATTIHLHFEMYENYVAAAEDEPLFTKVNPYMTLVAAYDRRLREE